MPSLYRQIRRGWIARDIGFRIYAAAVRGLLLIGVFASIGSLIAFAALLRGAM